jgi:hypothetical protein
MAEREEFKLREIRPTRMNTDEKHQNQLLTRLSSDFQL